MIQNLDREGRREHLILRVSMKGGVITCKSALARLLSDLNAESGNLCLRTRGQTEETGLQHEAYESDMMADCTPFYPTHH